MATEFIQLVDDLSYAKTFYPTSRTTRYLNVAAARIYLGIYRNRKEDANRLGRFCRYDLPRTIRRYHSVLLLAFILFMVFFAVGMFSARRDESFIRGMFGDEYVNMTEDNIAKGDPFGVYKQDNQLAMFLRIVLNNVQVAFLIFIVGFLLGLGDLDDDYEVCHGYQNACVCAGCLERAKPGPAPQPWEPKAVAA